ncbi:hypothetical protein CapIbe_012268 [Capra ibex]
MLEHSPGPCSPPPQTDGSARTPAKQLKPPPPRSSPDAGHRVGSNKAREPPPGLCISSPGLGAYENRTFHSSGHGEPPAPTLVRPFWAAPLTGASGG